MSRGRRQNQEPPDDEGEDAPPPEEDEASDEERMLADRIARAADGSIELHLTLRERQILRAMLDDLRAVLERDWPGRTRRFDPDDEGTPDEPERGQGAPGGEHPDAPALPGPADLDDDPADVLDPVLARLYPDARQDDPVASRRFRDLVGDDIAEGRIARLAIMDETLDEPSIDDRQAEAWLGVLNDLRLVMGTRLDVRDGTESQPIDEGDPEAAARIVYAYAGWLEGQLIDVLADALPEVPGDDEPPISST
jgi:Domain of unknown function (DUF2017)